MFICLLLFLNRLFDFFGFLHFFFIVFLLKLFHFLLISFSRRFFDLVKLLLVKNLLLSLFRLNKRLQFLTLLSWNFVSFFELLTILLCDSYKLVLKLLVIISILFVHNRGKMTNFLLDVGFKIDLLLFQSFLLGKILKLGLKMYLSFDLGFLFFGNFFLFRVYWILIRVLVKLVRNYTL